MKVRIDCNFCPDAWTIVSTDSAPDGWLEDHIRQHPSHTFRLEKQEDVPGYLTDAVRKHQKWIDDSRARIIELERIVDLLLIGVIRRGDYALEELSQLKRGTA